MGDKKPKRPVHASVFGSVRHGDTWVTLALPLASDLRWDTVNEQVRYRVAVRLGSRVIPEATVQHLLTLVYIAMGVILSVSLLLSSMGVDVLTSLTAAIAAVFNIGPAFSRVGPFDNYGWFPAGAKWVLSVCMIAGRLEFYSALVLVTPRFWLR